MKIKSRVRVEHNKNSERRNCGEPRQFPESIKDRGCERVCYSVMDMIKIIITKSTEINTMIHGIQNIQIDNEKLRDRMLVATRIIPLHELKKVDKTIELEGEIDIYKKG